VEILRTRKTLLALLALILVISVMAIPVVSKSNFSGNQQYGYCDSCHSAQSTMTLTMQSSPSTANAIAPGATVTVWVNASGSMSGATQVGALIASTTSTSNSLPSNGGWTITSDPSGSATSYNYYKFTPYSSSHSFKWVLTAPQTTGTHSLYGRIMHSGSQEYYKNVGPLTFNVQSVPVNAPQVTITSPLNGATVSGSIIVTGMATAATGATIASVVLNIDGAQRGTTTSITFSFVVDTTTLLNGAHTIQVVATDNGARTGSQSITVTASNVVPTNPIVLISSPTNGQMVTGSVGVNAAVTAGQGATISYVSFKVGSIEFGNDTSSPYSATLNTNSYADGTHYIDVTAVDNGGRRGSQTITLVVNNTGIATIIPIVTIVSPINGAVLTGSFNVTAAMSSALPLTGVDLLIDGASQGLKTTGPYTWGVNGNSLSPGAHGINVTATDNNAKVGFQEITVTVSGYVGPTVRIDSPTVGGEYDGMITVTANLTSEAGVDYVILRINGQQVANATTAPFSWQLNTANYLDGYMVINVTAVDLAGKRGYSEVSIAVDNAGQDEPLLEMAATTIAGFLGIIALVLTLTTAVMFYRNKRGGGA
jgi:hypothetical protein